jgi:hypothetical protein
MIERYLGVDDDEEGGAAGDFGGVGGAGGAYPNNGTFGFQAAVPVAAAGTGFNFSNICS